jgi:hypothetical protein
LAYYYIRTLIYRPAVGSSLGPKAAPALLSISESSKHIVQIIQLLEERSMIFSFCLNKADLLIMCGMTLLYQVIDLNKDSKVMRDDERLVNAVIKIVSRAEAPGAWDFRRAASRFIAVDEAAISLPSPTSRESSASTATPPQRASPPNQLRRKAVASFRHDSTSSETDLLQQQERIRRMTMPSLAGQDSDFYRSPSRQSFESLPPESSLRQRSHRSSMTHSLGGHCPNSRSPQNLDFLPLSNNSPSQPQPRQPSPQHNRMQPPSSVPSQHNRQAMPHHMASKLPAAVSSTTEWEMMLGSLDGGMNNVYDAIYGGPGFGNEAAAGAAAPTSSQGSNGNDWSPDTWDLSTFNIADFNAGPPSNPAAPQSVLSLSDESLSSGEEVAPSELGLTMGNMDFQPSGGNMMSAAASCGGDDGGFILDGLERFPL